MAVVYMHTCSVTNKSYIGVTRKGVKPIQIESLQKTLYNNQQTWFLKMKEKHLKKSGGILNKGGDDNMPAAHRYRDDCTGHG